MVMELPTIRWCETHDEPMRSFDEGPTDMFGDPPREACSVGMCDNLVCTIVSQVRLPVDFDERMKAQGLTQEFYTDSIGAYDRCDEYPISSRRWVSAFLPVEDD